MFVILPIISALAVSLDEVLFSLLLSDFVSCFALDAVFWALPLALLQPAKAKTATSAIMSIATIFLDVFICKYLLS